MTAEDPSPAFSEESTRTVLAEACARVGLDPSGATVLRLGENAIYCLAGAPVVVRIARSRAALEDVRKEMRVARWLKSEDFPAAELADENGEDVLMVDGRYPVTFWRYITSTPPEPSEASLGRLLRELHGLTPPAWVELPSF